jgi:hypothetical protein
MSRAEEAIANEETIIYDVAANYGQMVDNVKHMSWFVQAVADEIRLDLEPNERYCSQ